MSKKETIKYDILKKCDLCGQPVLVCDMGQGRCKHCNWYQMKYCLEHPDEVTTTNHVSFNRAKQLLKEGKPLKPNLEEFQEMFRQYGEWAFSYKSKKYGVLGVWNKAGTERFVVFYEWNVMETEQEYKTIEEFAAKANINGVLLKDIWDKVEEIEPA